MTEEGTYDLLFINDLTATQEHFLKKFLVEEQLKEELHYLGKPDCLQYLGPPFHTTGNKADTQLPLLRYFFSNFVATFPLIANNTPQDQEDFWKNTVQPFVESFNEKNISDAVERKELVTKRHQVNVRLLGALLLFYNSMISSKKELQYLHEDHLKPSDKGKLDKLTKRPAKVQAGLESFQPGDSLHDYASMEFVNDVNLNIVAVDIIAQPDLGRSKPWYYNPLRSFSMPDNQPHYCFVMQVTRRKKVEDDYQYTSHFISRPYLEFNDLEHALRKKYPGVMSTEVNKMPHKLKHDKGVTGDFTDTDSSKDSATSEDLRFANVDATPKYYREKLRLALRGYINSLLAKPEIVHCEVMEAFIDDKDKNFSELSPAQARDHEQRMELEKHRLETQQQFQEHIAKIVYSLSQDFEKFKADLVQQRQLLSKVFEEFGTTLLMEELSPLLSTFFEWCKLEIAATLYQVFLTQDNSSEWLHKLRKFHRLFPYNVCYGVLKYTNPVKVMLRLVDVLLADLPSFGRKKNEVNNMLLMIFVTLLDEDLSEYTKEREKHMTEPPLNAPEYAIFVERILNYVHLDNVSAQEAIKDDAGRKGDNLLMEILATDRLSPQLGADDAAVMERIRTSFAAYTELHEHRQVDSTEVFVALRQLWQLEMRARDKQMMKQLWREPELTRLLKQFLTIFYQPLMTVMKKCGIHLVFRDWQHFVDDLMVELTRLDEGDMYYTSSVEMFNRFKQLLDKHQGALWRFMHNLYTRDEDRLFMKLILWIESFLVALRAKFVAPETVLLDMATMSPSQPVNRAAFERELNTRIGVILEKRRAIKVYLQASAGAPKQRASARRTEQREIDDKWDLLNLRLFDMKLLDLGLALGDVEEFNLDHIRSKAAGDLGDDAGYAELQQKIAHLDLLVDAVSGSELAKLSSAAHAQFCALLRDDGLEKSEKIP